MSKIIIGKHIFQLIWDGHQKETILWWSQEDGEGMGLTEQQLDEIYKETF